MPVTVDDSGVLAGLDRLLATIDDAARDGLDDAAAVMEVHLQTTQAHGDQSGATRSSYRAYPIGPDRTGDAAATSGFAAAAEQLGGFTGHTGKPLREDSGVRLKADDRGIILTAFTDYQDDLETEEAGKKAVLTPTLQQDATLATQAVARASRQKLG